VRKTAWVSNRYQLTVDGELSDQVSSAFAGMTLTRNRGKTILEGGVRDQAELQALLQRVSDLGLTLLSASTVDHP
jgi:shikimate kinase